MTEYDAEQARAHYRDLGALHRLVVQEEDMPTAVELWETLDQGEGQEGWAIMTCALWLVDILATGIVDRDRRLGEEGLDKHQMVQALVAVIAQGGPGGA